MTPTDSTTSQKMTLEEMRIAIAEALGWKPARGASYHGYEGSYLPAGWLSSKGHFSKELPHYPTDLNAMHEAEKVLTADKRGTYKAHLIDIAFGTPATNRGITFSTATQRAEAFCRTLFPERFKS